MADPVPDTPRVDMLENVARRDRVKLAALEREQREMAVSKPRPTGHRVTTVALSLHEERNGANQWRCAHCGATARFPDLFDDFECVATPLPGVV